MGLSKPFCSGAEDGFVLWLRRSVPAVKVRPMSRDTPSSTRLPGAPGIAVALRRSARARRYSLRISQLDGKVTLTLPLRASLKEGLAFLHERESWILDHLRARPAAVLVGHGQTVPFEGRTLAVVPGDGRGPRVERGQLLVPGDPERAGRRVQAFLKQAARERLAAASDRHAAALGRGYRRLTLRDTRSRWGSCSAFGDLMYSWRLVMAPAAVLDYVAAHEVAHLEQMNHSPAFWALVSQLCPDHEVPRTWLRREGATLHRYRFSD